MDTTTGQSSLGPMLQLQMMNQLKSGNILIDAMLSSLLIMIVTSASPHVISFVKNLINRVGLFLSNSLSTSKSLSMRLIRYYFPNFMKDNTFWKTVEISYITENKQINELYKAVHWYLSNCDENDYLKEDRVTYFFEKKPSEVDPEKPLLINKQIPNQKSKYISYKNTTIEYWHSTETLTIYTDKERKRENYKITLRVQEDASLKKDVLDAFSQHCLREHVKHLRGSKWEQHIFTNEGTTWKSQKSNNRRNIDTVILKNGLKDKIKEDMNFFLKNESWYHKRDIPYSRGYLFYGVPGTGKTSMIKGISNFCERHIHYLLLNNVSSDSELLELFKQIDFKQTIVVIEDIDCMTDIVMDRNLSPGAGEKNKKKGRKTNDPDDSDSSDSEGDDWRVVGRKKKRRFAKSLSEAQEMLTKSKLTLSGLLNALDGVFNVDGRILIMTTNKPELLDSALIRPGRIDKYFLFDNCDSQQIRDIYEMFFEIKCTQTFELKANKYSPAQIISLFMKYLNQSEDVFEHLDEIEEKPKLLTIIPEN